MAEKDVVEKLLFDYEDVFADIVNVLLFNGKEVVKPDELETANTISQYKADNTLHQQERDVAKLWKRGGVKIALYGLENQTAIDTKMPLRVIAYDGASYRAQLLNSGKEESYPVITLILYFGEKRWNKPRTLFEALNIADDLKPYVNDYKLNIIEVAYLSDEQLRQFKSDFGIMADFFVNRRKNKDYIPKDERKFKHVDGVLKFLSVMTQDPRYESSISVKEGDVTMDALLDRVEQRGVVKGIEQGIAKGIVRGIAEGEKKKAKETTFSLADRGMTVLDIAEILKVSEKQVEEWLSEAMNPA